MKECFLTEMQLQVGIKKIQCLIRIQRQKYYPLSAPKEGIGHIPLAFINLGDVVLVPSPGYPVYPVGTLFAAGESYIIAVKKKKNTSP